MTEAQLFKPYGKQEFQAFYTDADEIRSLMQELLGDVSSKKILEPCAGQGAFLDGLIGQPSIVHAVDIDKKHIQHLTDNACSSVKVIHTDFIDNYVSGSMFNSSKIHSDYDAVICNPPYGLRFTTDYRKQIKKHFPHLYARESYGLFLYFGINALVKGGRFVYIIPDTFFSSRNHLPLRNYLATETTITDVVQFRSKRFETVNFGYGSLCVIAGYKGHKSDIQNTRWVDARKSEEPLKTELTDSHECVPVSYFREACSTGWVHPKHTRAIKMPNSAVELGELAECRTGIYTGNNTLFCAYDAEQPPSRANGHAINWQNQVRQNTLTSIEKQQGISDDVAHYVPLIRGGHIKPFDVTKHAVRWSIDSVKFYRDDKKARLQNHAFYFRAGLAIPMVTSGRLSASLMQNAIFDQGVVGVFPNNEELIPFMLIYLNSDIVSEYKALINPGANNSANYIKRIPVPIAPKALIQEASELLDKSRKVGWEATKSERDLFVEKAISI